MRFRDCRYAVMMIGSRMAMWHQSDVGCNTFLASFLIIANGHRNGELHPWNSVCST